MSNSPGPLYECTYVIAAEASDEFASWMRKFQQRAMQEPGIEDARGYEPERDAENDDGFFRLVFRFKATDDHALDQLLDGFFSEADGELAALFGEKASLQSRILREEQPPGIPSAEQPNCLNCGTRLRGQYCGTCGQRSRSRLISIWQLLKEAFGDLFEIDSRLWQTLLPLLIRPGRLTRDYLEGRRARYMPPFRTYLVLSVMFFVVAFFDPQEFLEVINPTPTPTAEESAQVAEADQVAAAARREQLEQARERLVALEAEGKIAQEVVDEFDTNNDWVINLGGDDIEIDGDGGMFGDCDDVTISDEDDIPEWISQRFSDERIKQICERNKARGNDNFVDAILDNIPIALIVLLPIMALVLKILYPLSRRYFVEHLLFFLHFHAFFFLMLMLQILFMRTAGLLGDEDSAIHSIAMLIVVIASFYIPVYLYKAMRLVYGQGHLITIFKYLILFVAYTTGAMMTMFGAFLVALLTA